MLEYMNLPAKCYERGMLKKDAGWWHNLTTNKV
jgi:hypothetical protein